MLTFVTVNVPLPVLVLDALELGLLDDGDVDDDGEALVDAEVSIRPVSITW